MYNLPDYKDPDPRAVIQFMYDHPFAMLCGSTHEGQPVATQLPMLIQEDEQGVVLRGHFMKNTDHHKAFIQNPTALAVFTGPHTYVSASWYTNPHQGSTWNYMTVQAAGDIRFLDDTSLVQILSDTTTRFEHDEQSVASFKHIPKDYIDKLIVAIVGFELRVVRLEHVFKLSQDKNEQSRESVIRHLQNRNDEHSKLIAGEMSKRMEGTARKS